MTDAHDRFTAWLSEAEPDDPRRDLAVHASTCAECLSRAAALDALRRIDVGVAEVPPVLASTPDPASRIVIVRRWAVGVATVAVIVLSIAALTKSFGIVSVGGLRLGAEPSPTVLGAVLADGFAPPEAVAEASPSSSEADGPTGSAAPIGPPLPGIAVQPGASVAPGASRVPAIPSMPGFTPPPIDPTEPIGTPTPAPTGGGPTPGQSASAGPLPTAPSTPEPTPPILQTPTPAPTAPPTREPTPPPTPEPTPPPTPEPTPEPTPPPTPEPTPTPGVDASCTNGIDDDGDTLIDLADPGCLLPFGSESLLP